MDDEELIGKIWAARPDWPRQALAILRKRDEERDLSNEIHRASMCPPSLVGWASKHPVVQAAVLEELAKKHGKERGISASLKMLAGMIER
jgi:hypothetical protein